MKNRPLSPPGDRSDRRRQSARALARPITCSVLQSKLPVDDVVKSIGEKLTV